MKACDVRTPWDAVLWLDERLRMPLDVSLWLDELMRTVAEDVAREKEAQRGHWAGARQENSHE